MFKKILVLALTLTLAACQTQPVAPEKPPRFTPEQIMQLQSAGFVQDPESGDWNLNLDGEILFDIDQSALNPNGLKMVANVVQVLQKVGLNTIVVEGHTDNTGSAEHNIKLSAARAQSVANEIGKLGLPHENIIQRHFGDARPLESNTTPQGRAKNRRVTLIVVAGS